MAQQPVSLDQIQNGTGVAAKPKRGLLDILSDPRVKEGFGQVVGKAMTPERMIQMCITAAKGNDRLLQCDPSSVLGAMMTAAALGLEPNTPQQQAYLIPYAKRGKNPETGKWEVIGFECQFQIGYRGYITLAHRSPHIAYLQAECIHEHDVFDHMEGSTSFLKFQKKLNGRGKPIGAFAFVKFTNGSEMACVLDLEELEKIRECSDTYTSLRDAIDKAETDYKRAQAQKKFDETPWVLWFDDMAAKSAIKKVCKQLPMEQGQALSIAADLDRDDGRIIDMASMAEAAVVSRVARGEQYAPEVEQTPAISYAPGETIPFAMPQENEQPELVEAEQQPQRQQRRQPVAEQKSEPQGPTRDELLARIGRTSDPDEVQSALADSNHLPDEQRKVVEARASAKLAELESGSNGELELD